MFAAPELLRGERYDEAVDLYSFGCTMVALWKRGDAYEKGEKFSVGGVAYRELRPAIPEACPPTIAKLVLRCLAKESEVRPSFEKLVTLLEKGAHKQDERAADENAGITGTF